MHIATLEDVQTIKDLSLKFMESVSYMPYHDPKRIEGIILELIEAPKTESIILVDEGGFLAATVVPFMFGFCRLATEVAWYVSPEKRKTGLGSRLLAAFEYWAKEKADCKLISMGALDDTLGQYFENKGYKLYERAYMKEL